MNKIEQDSFALFNNLCLIKKGRYESDGIRIDLDCGKDNSKITIIYDKNYKQTRIVVEDKNNVIEINKQTIKVNDKLMGQLKIE